MQEINWKYTTGDFRSNVMKVFTLFKVITLIACFSASFKNGIAFYNYKNFNCRERILKEEKSKLSILYLMPTVPVYYILSDQSVKLAFSNVIN